MFEQIAIFIGSWLRRASAAAFLGCLLLQGCAPLSPNAKYLFSPDVRTCAPLRDANGEYSADSWCSARVDQPIPDARSKASDARNGGTGQTSSVTVSQATNYARQIEGEYMGAKTEYGSLSSAFGLPVIAAGTSALALGAVGASSTAVTSLGFGTAGLLGMGYWLSNPAREKVYMTGSDALECLIDVMQPFDTEQMNFELLDAHDETPVNRMAFRRTELDVQANKLERDLVIAKGLSSRCYHNKACAAAKPALCYAETALKAAKLSQVAESKAYDASLKYYTFSYYFAGEAMVGAVNTINNKVSEAMTKNEPDLHSLANGLNGAIPSSAQTLAGISDAKPQNAAAAAAIAKIVVASPATGPASGTGSAAGGAGPGKASEKCTEPCSGGTSIFLRQLIERAALVQMDTIELYNSTATVIDLTPESLKPKTDSCTKLFDDSGSPPDQLTLNPDGYIALKPGDKSVVAISGGKLPFAVTMMSDFGGKGVTAEVDYDSSKASVAIVAGGSASAGNYSMLVSDATGVGRPLFVVVSDKTKEDSSDTIDCIASDSPPVVSAATPKSRSTMRSLFDDAIAQAGNAGMALKKVNTAVDSIPAKKDSEAALKLIAAAFAADASASKAADAAAADLSKAQQLAAGNTELSFYLPGIERASTEAKASAVAADAAIRKAVNGS